MFIVTEYAALNSTCQRNCLLSANKLCINKFGPRSGQIFYLDQSKEEGKDQKSIQSSTKVPDPDYNMVK